MTSNPSLRAGNTISVDDLAALKLSTERLTILDVRFTPGKPGRIEDYLAEHIPGARYIDLPTQLADPSLEGRGSNPLPSIDRLEEDLRRLGVSDVDQVVIYDDTNGAPAARAWWTLGWSGIRDVRILSGGLGAWKAAGQPVSSGQPPAVQQGAVNLTGGKLPFIDADNVAAFPNIGTLVDARPALSYRSEGNAHIPGAKSFPADRLIDANGKLVEAQELKRRLADAGIDIERPVAAYCGGGIACSLFTLALAEIGKEVTVYPGSWSEWTFDKTRPIET